MNTHLHSVHLYAQSAMILLPLYLYYIFFELLTNF